MHVCVRMCVCVCVLCITISDSYNSLVPITDFVAYNCRPGGEEGVKPLVCSIIRKHNTYVVTDLNTLQSPL